MVAAHSCNYWVSLTYRYSRPKLEYSTGNTDYFEYDLVRDESPHTTAKNFINNKVDSDSMLSRYVRWTRKFTRRVYRA